jgi:hypothetical protein
MKRIREFLNIGLLLSVLFILGTLIGSCGRDDNPAGGDDDRTGEPYKVRIEVSAAHPDLFNLAIVLGSYNYVENGLPRTGWLTDPDVFVEETAVPSPLIEEYEIPRNFTKFFIDGAVFSIDIQPSEMRMNEDVTGKLFVNNKLIASSTAKFSWTFAMVYDAAKKKYVITYSNGKDIELDKLD